MYYARSEHENTESGNWKTTREQNSIWKTQGLEEESKKPDYSRITSFWKRKPYFFRSGSCVCERHHPAHIKSLNEPNGRESKNGCIGIRDLQDIILFAKNPAAESQPTIRRSTIFVTECTVHASWREWDNNDTN
jgi:hypothetical protein